MSTQRSRDEGSTDRVKVFLRIRPLTEAERGQGEEQVRHEVHMKPGSWF